MTEHGGTPRYRSPQQRAGQPRGPTDDVFALGEILADLVRATEPLKQPDDRLRRVIRRARARTLAHRHGSVDQLRAALLKASAE